MWPTAPNEIDTPDLTNKLRILLSVAEFANHAKISLFHGRRELFTSLQLQ